MVTNHGRKNHPTAMFAFISEVFILKGLSSPWSSESLLTTITYPSTPEGPFESVSQQSSWFLPHIHLNWTPDYQNHKAIDRR